MLEDENPKESPEIKEVLKALNHVKRRDILLYLKDLRRETGFSELMDYLNVDPKSSGQFSYHIKLLLTADLIQKKNEKYLITTLGLKASSMLDMVDITEKNESIVQKISNSYKNISVLDQIIIAFEAFTALLFVIPLEFLLRNVNHFVSEILIVLILIVIGISLFMFVTFYSYVKLRYIPSLLILSSVIWVIFLPYNQIKIGIIYLFSVFSLIFLYQGFLSSNSSTNAFFNYFLALFCFFITIISILLTIYNENVKKEKIV